MICHTAPRRGLSGKAISYALQTEGAGEGKESGGTGSSTWSVGEVVKSTARSRADDSSAHSSSADRAIATGFLNVTRYAAGAIAGT